MRREFGSRCRYRSHTRATTTATCQVTIGLGGAQQGDL